MGHWGEVEENVRDGEREGLDGYRARLVLTMRERVKKKKKAEMD